MKEYQFKMTRYGGELDGLDFKAFVTVDPTGFTEAVAHDGSGKQVWLTQEEIAELRGSVAELYRKETL